MYNLIYSEEVDRDLTAIFNLQKNPELGTLGKYPELQRLGVRVLPFEHYLILYTVNERNQSVNLLRVIHGSVNYKRLF